MDDSDREAPGGGCLVENDQKRGSENQEGGGTGSPRNPLKPSKDSPAVLRIRPSARWGWLDLPELWCYRDLLWSLAFRDLRLRYRQTALGVLWVVFQPLAGAGVFTLVFGWVAGMQSSRKSYFLFSLAGLLAWNAFQSTLSKSSMALLGNAQLVSKVYFPRLLLPFSTVLSTVVDFLIGICAFLVVGISSAAVVPWPGLCILPFWIVIALSSALGLGLLAASLMTRYRDVQHVLPILLPFLMYASPVAYGLDSVPKHWGYIFKWNPMTWVLEGARAALIGGEAVPGLWVAYAAAVSLGLFVAGVCCFRRMERSFADVF